ncbi:MAG: ATP-dependent DNA helicase [Prevotella sp.]
MNINEFICQISEELGFPPTEDQHHAMLTFGRFLADRNTNTVMVMRGSAGTGKTSLAGAMVRTMKRLGQKLTLMAPTGRAAKVFALHSGLPAYTIHRRIYREKAYHGLDGQFLLNNNLYHSMLFVVDEASMISTSDNSEGIRSNAFGSGSLLDDLIQYVYSGQNCRLLLIGDSAQLPPVGEEEAPALSTEILRGYGLKVYETNLDMVVRQNGGSGILWNATALRRLITHDEATKLPIIRFKGFADIIRVPGDELIESLASSYSLEGKDETIVITRSNKRANIYNQGIRNTVLDREEALCGGDRLMVVRNNYYWTDKEQREHPKEALPLSFLANGDTAEVLRVRNIREFYGFHFADVWLRFPDYDNYEMQLTVIMDSLSTEAPALTHEQNERLFGKVMEDYADLHTKPERLKALRQDIYFNALQVKFAYAVTCHKAQGGQWRHVYLDQGYMTDDMLTPDYIHWLYTAFTRATSKLFLVNWPKNQCDTTDEDE